MEGRARAPPADHQPLEEGLAVIRKAWEQGRTGFTGTPWRLPDQPLGPRPSTAPCGLPTGSSSTAAGPRLRRAVPPARAGAHRQRQGRRRLPVRGDRHLACRRGHRPGVGAGPPRPSPISGGHGRLRRRPRRATNRPAPARGPLLGGPARRRSRPGGRAPGLTPPPGAITTNSPSGAGYPASPTTRRCAGFGCSPPKSPPESEQPFTASDRPPSRPGLACPPRPRWPGTSPRVLPPGQQH